MADTTNPPRRRRRKWLYVTGAVLLLIILFIALLPTMVGWGLGQGYIRNAIAKNINGDVKFAALRPSWFGNQELEHLTIVDSTGRTVADLNVIIRGGLFQVITQRPGPLNVTVSGTIAGDVRADGSTSFADLIRTAPKPSQPQPQQPKPSTGQPFRLPQLPPLTVNVNGLTAKINYEKTNQQLVVDNLTGKLVYDEPSAPIIVDLQGKTMTDSTPGSLSIKGEADNLFASDGTLSLKGASAKLQADVQSVPIPVPVPGIEGPTQIQSLSMNLASDDLTGRIVGSVEAHAQVADQNNGYLLAQIAVSNVLNNAGQLALSGGTANIMVQAQNLPFNTADLKGQLHQFRTTIVSNDLTKTIVIAIDSNAELQNQPASILTASLSVDDLLSPEGKVQFAPEKITGTIQGSTIPTAILQPALANTPLVVSRDLGPVMDVNASFSAGATRDITMMVNTALAQLGLKATVDTTTQAIKGDHLLLTAIAQPELVKNLARVAIDQPTEVSLELTSFSIPPSPPGSSGIHLPDVGAAGTLAVRRPIMVTLPSANAGPANDTPPAQPISLSIQGAIVQLTSPRLGDFVNVKGSASVDGGMVNFDEHITRLFDASGKLDPMNAAPAGTLTVTDLPATTIAKFAPQRTDLINEVIGRTIAADVETSQSDSGLAATVQARGDALNVALSAVRQPQALSVISGHVELTASPKLVQLLQKPASGIAAPGASSAPSDSSNAPNAASANPIAIAAPTKITLGLQPFEMPATGPFKYELPKEPVTVNLEVGNLVVNNAPGLAEPVGLNNLAAEVTANLAPSEQSASAAGAAPAPVAGAQWKAEFNGDVEIIRPKTSKPVAASRYRGSITQAEPIAISLNVGVTGISMPDFESLLGRPQGSLSQWTGNGGGLSAQLRGSGKTWDAALALALDNIAGDFTGKIDPDAVTLVGHTSKFVVSRQTLESRLNPQAAAGGASNSAGSSQPADRIRVIDDVPLELTIAQMRLPMAMVRNEAFDPKASEINITVHGGPMRFASATVADASLSDIEAALTSRNLADGVGFTLNGKSSATVAPSPATVQQSPPPGAISSPPPAPPSNSGSSPRANSNTSSGPTTGAVNINGKIVDLISESSTLAPAGAKLRLDAKVTDVPTAVADAAMKMEGLLVAALGPMMNATIDANRFSPETGRVEARLETTNGWLEAIVFGRENGFRINKANPAKAELALTPPLRERLLNRIHPILADIRTMEQPIRATIASANAPLKEGGAGMDISRLNSDLEITVGKVQFDSGSTVLGVLKLFGQQQRAQTVPGEIEPIIAKIRNGVVTYDRFAVHIDKWTMLYSGEINLVQGTVNVRTELPLAALAHTFQELEGIADKIVVPIVTRGKFGELKTTIDPSFDLGKEAVKAGFQGGIDQLLKKGKLGDLLKGIKP